MSTPIQYQLSIGTLQELVAKHLTEISGQPVDPSKIELDTRTDLLDRDNKFNQVPAPEPFTGLRIKFRF